jgi:hypothetical protein
LNKISFKSKLKLNRRVWGHVLDINEKNLMNVIWRLLDLRWEILTFEEFVSLELQ